MDTPKIQNVALWLYTDQLAQRSNISFANYNQILNLKASSYMLTRAHLETGMKGHNMYGDLKNLIIKSIVTYQEYLLNYPLQENWLCFHLNIHTV